MKRIITAWNAAYSVNNAMNAYLIPGWKNALSVDIARYAAR